MNTLQSMLDEHGIPPPEICLDWAWQLRQLVRDARPAESLTCGEPELAWRQVAINETGELTLLEPVSPGSRDAAVSQLVQWSGRSPNAARDVQGERITGPSRNPLDDLRQATVRWIEGVDQTSAGTKRPCAPALQGSSAPSTLVDETKHARAVASTDAFHDTKRALKSPPRLNRGHKNKVARIKLFASVAAVVAVGLGWTLIPSSRDNAAPLPVTKHLLSSAQMSPSVSGSAESAGNLASTTPILAIGDEITLSTSLDSTTFDNAALNVPAVPPMPAGILAINDALPSLSTKKNDSLEPKVGPENSSVGVTSGDVPSLESRKSVLEEIQATTSKADAETSAIEVPTVPNSAAHSSDQPAKNSSEPPALAPLRIDCEAMRQVFKLKDDTTIKPKSPNWRLRLELSQDFTVEPTEVQLLSPGQSVFWMVYDSEAKAPRARVVVHAQQASGRVGDLRWRVYGCSEDLPNLSLPLSRRWLDPLRDQLKKFDQFLQSTRDGLQDQSQQPGLSSKKRSPISVQRQWIDQQQRILQRCVVVMAETDRLVGLLDGQFQVHAELKDGTDAQARAMLKYGAVDARAK